ncbi:MAG: glycosyltransferase family 2 protein [Candidatus Dormibacteraeota bacterium]|nr:glycosyltransferase family 2 protein [Candidatus Dormibacteraeota bacterium]
MHHPGVSPDELDDRAIEAFVREREAESNGLELPPVVVVIAAYNEEEAIGAVLDGLPAEVCGMPAATLVVVDGAADGTAEVARRHGAVVCEVPVNRGQGAALRLGYRIAREGGARYLITTDADGQYDPADVESLLGPVLGDEADFVTGSRRLGQEETTDPVRRLGVRVFAWLVSALAGQRITDTSFGLRAMRADVTAEVELRQPQYQAAELLIALIASGHRVMERPGRMRRRLAGESKKGHNLLFGLRYARVVIGTWLRERRSRHVP